MRAQTAPSSVYDYYNPEAHATVRPVLFTVADRAAAPPAAQP